MRMSLQISSPALAVPITATGSGAFDLPNHSGSMSMTMTGTSGAAVQIEMVMQGSTVYVRLPSALASGGKPWVKGDLLKLSHVAGLSSLGRDSTVSDPTRILDSLRSVSDGVVNEGRERINGVAATHYQAEVIPSQLLGHGADAAIAQAMPATIPVDVWIDSRQLVRRVRLSLDMSAPGGQSLQELVSLDLGHYGPQPAPVIPPPAQVADLGG
jgi:hypothetical protein